LYYATWWPIDRWIYVTLVLHTPIPGVDTAEASNLLFPGLTEPAPKSRQVPPAAGSTSSGDQVRKILLTTAPSWLTLSTLSYGMLALSAGAAWGRTGTHTRRKLWLFLLVLGVGMLLLAGGWVAWQYGMEWPSEYSRYAFASVAAFPFLVGLGLRRGARFLCRLAGVFLIVAALGTALSLYLLGRCGAVEERFFGPSFLAMVFAAHSLYGWLLLIPIGSRVGRS
jgi:hypothetical protein